ncbi:MAG: cation-transporting P-type ATPase [Clostridia bacterium]
MTEKEETINIQELYGKDSFEKVENYQQKNQIHIQTGLSNQEVENRIQQYGSNQMKQTKPKKWYQYLLQSLFSPFNLILLGITVVLFYTDVYLTNPPSYANILVIVVLISVSTLLEFFEVFQSNKAAEKLKRLVETKATVLRQGKEERIPLRDLTIGDIVILSAGDIIPAI